jgi:hypothetical protein
MPALSPVRPAPTERKSKFNVREDSEVL